MTIFGRMLAALVGRGTAATVDKRSPHNAWFFDWLLGGAASASGVRVTSKTALHSPPIYAGVQAVAQDIAKLPLNVLRVDPASNTRRPWRDNVLWDLLHNRPNPDMTSYRFREALQAQVMLEGNAFAFIELDRRGVVSALYPFEMGEIQILRGDGSLPVAERRLFYRVNGTAETIPGDRMLHLRGLTLDGSVGTSAIKNLQDSIGIALAAQDYAARFYANDATPRSVFRRLGHFQDQAKRDQFRQYLKQALTGENRHAPLVLEDGFELDQLGMSNEDAQFIETRRHQWREGAAGMRVPPHKVGDLEKATFSNIEHQAIEYVQDALLPHVTNWESELFNALVPERERAVTEIELDFDALLRGDMRTRGDYFSKALGSGGTQGWLTPNEVRRREGENPHQDGEGLPAPTSGSQDTSTGSEGNDDENMADGGRVSGARQGGGAGRFGLRAVPD